MAHGYAKLMRGPESFAVVLQTLGVPEPLLLSWATTLVELTGGAAVIAGAFIPIVSVPMGIVLLTAMYTVHFQYGFFSVKFAEVTANGIKFGTGRLRDRSALSRWPCGARHRRTGPALFLFVAAPTSRSMKTEELIRVLALDHSGWLATNETTDRLFTPLNCLESNRTPAPRMVGLFNLSAQAEPDTR